MILRFLSKGMWTIGRKIQLHRIGIGRTAAPRTMLPDPRDDFSSPRRVGRRPSLARNCTNRCHWRRKRLLFIRKYVLVRQVVHKGRGVPERVDARRRLTAKRASHGPVRRFSPGAGGIRTGPSFAFTKLAVVTCPDWLSTACVPNISLLSQQDCFVTCLSPHH